MPYTYQYPHPAVTVDCVVFGFDGKQITVLLIERLKDPFAGCWALPGGFVEIQEGLDAAAARELEEETGVKELFLEQLYTYGAPERDPRERVISVAYLSLMCMDRQEVKASSDARDAKWFRMNALPDLAFDHQIILDYAFKRLTAKVVYEPIIFELLPSKFSLAQLERLYELLLNESFDSQKFRIAFLNLGILTPVSTEESAADGGSAMLYKFDPKKFEKLKSDGADFEIRPEFLRVRRKS